MQSLALINNKCGSGEIKNMAPGSALLPANSNVSQIREEESLGGASNADDVRP